ncbi:MAG TPA: hypothetical protein P5102_17340, partial [Candidatus Competibacteraceae bacterium]|nr:hypothetical protein [Candidatus Competibacteraceae bacterium]
PAGGTPTPTGEAPAAGTAPPTGATPEATTPAPREAVVESPTPMEKNVTSPPTPVEAPVAEGGSEPSGSGSPSPETKGLEKPPVAGPGQKPMDTGEMPEAAHSESAPSGATSVPVPGLAPAVTTKPPADASAGQTAKTFAGQKPQASDAKPPPKRPTRQKTVQKRKEQPIVVAPAQPVQARPTPAAPKRSNLWDAPTDSGFNQK